MQLSTVLRSTLAGPILLATACFETAGNGAPGRTWYVDQNNHTGIANGSPESPLVTIQEGIDASSPGDEVRVAPGHYLEKLEISHGLRLVGAGSATTVLDGDGGGPILRIDKKLRNVHIEGFTFTGGVADVGAVCSVDDVGLTFRSCYFTLNQVSATSEAFVPGVLRLANGGAYRIEQCVFFDNDNNGIGGSVPGSVTIENTVLAMLSRSGIQIGGDPDSHALDMVLRNVTVWGCTLDGVRIGQYTDAVLTNVLLAENQADIRESTFAGDPHLYYALLEGSYFDVDLDQDLRDPPVAVICQR